MACLGGDCMIGKQSGGYFEQRSGRVSGSIKPNSLSITIPNLAAKVPNRRVSTAVNATVPVACDSGHRSVNLSLFDDYTSIDSPRVSEKFDEWIHNSVTEIVKNIEQAPLLVQIYADGEMETKKAVTENEWRNVSERKTASVEGVILVEELRENVDLMDSGDEFDEGDGTRAFGVLIQGRIKGRDQCKSTCYLLKTSSVNGGMGHFCTHFCLMKVKNFHQDAFSQFNDCWLLK